MKILVISEYNSFVPYRPEAEVFIELHNQGIEVEIICEDNSEHALNFKNHGIKVHGFHPTKKIDNEARKRIKQILIDGKHDFLHLFNTKAIINGLHAAKNLDVKIILYRGYTGNIHWYDPTIYAKYFHPRVDAIWCNSESIRQLFCKQLTFNCNKAFTINKGHRPEWYNQAQEVDIRKELKLPEDTFIAVCVANARKMKGMDYLTEASLHLPQGLPIHFLYIGNDLDTQSVMDTISKSPYKENFHFLGYREDALGIVKASDIFTLASITGESITKALIEAMSLGCAPVATDISGNIELLIDGKTGIVVKKKNAKSMADGILTMYNNPELKAQIAKNAKKHIAENIHTLTTTKKLIELYKHLKPNIKL